MDYDFKRKPSLRWMQGGKAYPEHLSFLTEPFRDLPECLRYREGWERFRRMGRSLMTTEDLRKFEDFLEGDTLCEKGLKRSRQGLAKVAMRQFLRNLVRHVSELGRDRQHYKWRDLAEVLSRSGVEVSVSDLKNAGRNSAKLISRSIPRTPEVMRLVEFLRESFPQIDTDGMLELAPPTTRDGSIDYAHASDVDKAAS